MILKHLNYEFVLNECRGHSKRASVFYVELVKEKPPETLESVSFHRSLLETYDCSTKKEADELDFDRPRMNFSFRTHPERRNTIICTRLFHKGLLRAFDVMLEDDMYIDDNVCQSPKT